jgi:hypothetical protein
MKRQIYLIAFSFIALLSCNQSVKKTTSTNRADAIYYGGDIITMEGNSGNYAEAVAIKNGKIVFVGTKAEAEKMRGDSTVMNDLQGKTLIPGFIDGHSHLTNYADALLQADLNPPPIGKVNSIADIITALKELKEKTKASDTAWLVGVGYDQDFLKEKRHPTADDLDPAFPTNPVILKHTSGHMLVANSAAFKAAGITASTPDPPTGGTFIRRKGTNVPEGLVQETAAYVFFPFISKPLPMEQEMDKLKKAQDYYASCGVTTAADHLVLSDKMAIFEYAAKHNNLFLDMEVLPVFLMAKELIGTGKINWGTYNHHLKYAGLKMVIDGSPQGKTAFLSKPYNTPVPGCTHDCKGFPNLTQQQVNDLFLLCYKNNVQLFSHCNGDAAIDMMIKGHEYAIATLKDSAKDHRTVIVHSQIMRPDQLDTYKKYNLFPSFFTNHTYYWGDVHLANLGKERGNFISPMKSAIEMGIRCTNHTDNIITPLDQLFLLWTSVNRLSRSGKVIGANQRVSAYQGLQALTINGAYEYFEEDTKGSLKSGKLADLVVLDKNPLKVDVMKIKDIKVLETIKEGKIIYKRNQ